MPREHKKSAEQLAAELASLRTKVGELEELADEFRAQEKVLRRKEQVLHATLDSAADGILAVDENGHVIFSNKRFEKMWHIPPDLIEGGDDNELLAFVLDQLEEPDAFLARVRELYRSFQELTDTLRFRDGRVFERDSLPLVIEDQLCGRVWTFRDVTHRQPGE